MKKTRTLITFVLLALALNTTANTVEAKTRQSKKTAPADHAPATYTNKDVYAVTAISFSGLETLNEKEITASLPLKAGDRIAIPGPELPGVMQYLWQLQLFSDISVQQTDLDKKNITLKFTVKELPVLDQVTFEGNKKIDTDELRRRLARQTWRARDIGGGVSP